MYTTTKFLQEFKPTIGAEFSNKEMEVDGRTVVAQIWDTAGEERYQSLGISFYRGADCWAIVFDRSDRDTFEHLDMWRTAFMTHCDPAEGDSFPFLVIGNKSDLTDEVLVKEREAKQWWSEHGNVEYIEASAKNNISVEEAFASLITKGARRDWDEEAIPRKMMTQGRKLNLNRKDNSKDGESGWCQS